jgi:hypothetical protein
MKKIYTILFSMFLLLSLGSLQAQERYMEEIFTDVQVERDVVYGTNISVITGQPAPEDLKADVYTAVGDTETERPVVLVAHTGSFGPAIINGQTSGDRGDSTVVEICNRLARRGFVAVAFTYRLGWIPESPDPDIRQGTLLQAAYRAIQDTRTCVRYVKKTVAENGNPFGVDPNKITIWGIGTGGYLSVGAATLDDYEEVIIDKFLDQNNNPLADTALLGNFYGTTMAPLCLPNHPGYSSDFQLSINMGGAMGDLSWLDGDGDEPPIVGVHCPGDFFAPYYIGNVVVPTTNELVIEAAAGTRGFVGKANELGVNDVFNVLDETNDPLHLRIEAQKQLQYMTPGGAIDLGDDNMYAFFRPPTGTPLPEGSPWDWWDDNVVRAKAQFITTVLGIPIDADAVLAASYASNPDMSAEKGRRYIDTIFQLVTPRLCCALELDCNIKVGVSNLPSQEVGLKIGPIPARDFIDVTTSQEYPMESIMIYDLNGRLVQGHTDIENNFFTIHPKALASGQYVMQIRFEKGFTTTKISIQ